MSRPFVLRLLETFFRRWWLYMLPAVLLVAVGAQSVVTAKKEYVSKGVLYVESETLLSKLTGSDPATNNGFQTPAQTADGRITSLIGTDEFMRSIIERAGLTDLVSSGLLTLDGIRASIGTAADSPNTVRVGSTSADPQVAFRLATASIDSFIQWVIDASLSDSATAEKFLQSLAETYKTDVQTAKAAVDQFLKANPETIGTRPLSQTIELNRLTNDLTTAQARLDNTLAKAEDARLASAQTRSNVAGRLRLVDPPQVPSVSTMSRGKLVIQFAMFIFLGLALTAAAVFVGTVTDKSFRSPEEIRQRLGVPLLAVVPESRRSRADTPRRRRRRREPKVDAAWNGNGGMPYQVKVDEPVPADAMRQLKEHHA